MKIKRNSWHYQIRTLGDNCEPYNDTLCKYFWSIVKNISIIFAIIFILGLMIYAYVTNPNVIINTKIILFLLGCIILPSVVIRFLRKRYGKPIELPNENILKEYIKAKKEKICPLIEYID